MKNKMAIISLLAGCMIFAAFLFVGINVIEKYIDNKTNWHFITALIGTLLFASLLIASLAGIPVILFKSGHKNLLS